MPNRSSRLDWRMDGRTDRLRVKTYFQFVMHAAPTDLMVHHQQPPRRMLLVHGINCQGDFGTYRISCTHFHTKKQKMRPRLEERSHLGKK